MMIRNFRMQFVLVIRPAESPAVRQLQTDQQTIGCAETFPMGAHRGCKRRFQSPRRPIYVPNDSKLIRIGPTIFLNREGLASPDQLRAALAKVLPPANGDRKSKRLN